MTEVVTAKEWLNCESQLGEYMTDADYDVLVDSDMDLLCSAYIW